MMEITSEMIAEKLRQVDEFEARWGKNTTTIAMRKWCTDPKYREREKQAREAALNYIRVKGIPPANKYNTINFD